MNEILAYIVEYFHYVNKKLLLLCTIQTTILIFLNYHNRLEWQLTTNQSLAWPEFTGHLILFATAFVLPYLLMLVCMIPLIAAASTQPDFLAMYPKLKSVMHLAEHIRLSWFHKLLFELSYGSDFFGIEIFFRGFLILAFVRWAGMDAILPMACFYCTIHFGKPLGECISSYFGGLLLGIVVYNTRSIYGGLIVHLGIAWLMEIGGYMGNASS